MSLDRVIRKLTMTVAISLAPTLAFAQPGQTSLVSVQESGSYTFTFTRVAGATLYYLWVNEGGTLLFQKWFTAAEVSCAGTEVTCSIAVALPRAMFGTHPWWVQTWGPAGYGPWSSHGWWTSRPPMPPMVTDATGRYVGTLMSDNLVLLDVDGLPAKAIIVPTGFDSPFIRRWYLQAGCAGQGYGLAVIPDQIDFFTANGVSKGYLTRGTPITATFVSTHHVSWDGTVGLCTAVGSQLTLMPVTEIDLTSQLGSLTMPFKVVR